MSCFILTCYIIRNGVWKSGKLLASEEIFRKPTKLHSEIGKTTKDSKRRLTLTVRYMLHAPPMQVGGSPSGQSIVTFNGRLLLTGVRATGPKTKAKTCAVRDVEL